MVRIKVSIGTFDRSKFAIKLINILVAALSITSCATRSVQTESSMIKEIIPLKIVSHEAKAFVAEVKIKIDGKDKYFLLDTGAASSSIALDEDTKAYPSLGIEESRGASGKKTICHVIQPQKIEMGQHAFSKTKLKRCDRNILGMDLLGEQLFEVDLRNERLNILTEFPKTGAEQTFTTLATGHLTVPLKIQDVAVAVLFDTGADTTVIDTKFVKEHSHLFKLLRSEEGTDAHGNKIPSEVYSCKSVEIGILKIENVEMATFEFGDHLRSKMEGTPIILGNNVIEKARWAFDVKNKQWTSQPLSK